MINVLSICDGISSGRIAIDRIGAEVNYFASEIDPFAIKIAQKNYPSTQHLGDMLNWRSWNLPKIDLILSGTPCQSFSKSGKQEGFNGESGLFYTFLEILHHFKPLFFLMENVDMKKEWREEISKALGVSPVKINSSKTSAQNRQRLYWANFPISDPIDRNILLSSVVDGYVDRDKSYCIDASYYKGGNPNQYFNKCRRQLVFPDYENYLLAKSGQPASYRNLTVNEVEELQNLPRDYTLGVSKSKRYHAIGNGWTIGVIQHILDDVIKELAPQGIFENENDKY